MNRTCQVDVCIRVRPNRSDISESGTAWEIDPTRKAIHQRTNPDCRFAFDTIFPPSSTTAELYSQMVERSVLKNVLSGFNATCFVYGQTGSGKSYTMLGPGGIVPSVVTDVFDRCDGTLRRNKRLEKISFGVSMIEIYNEGLKDLLLSESDVKRPLSIRESSLRGAYVHNATVRKVISAQQLLHAIQHEAEVRRVSAATAMNPQSSRSHLIVRLEIEKIEYFDNGNDDEDDEDEEEEEDEAEVEANVKKRSYTTLNLVDLAGSERVATTGAVGVRLVEGGLINKSLTILTTVIHKLSEASTSTSVRVEHVPYRDSKLTHMLKSALGGNSFTTVIACISPADQQVDESRSTLHFASRAKTIRNNVSLNEINNNQGNMKMIKELTVKCDSLRKRLLASNFFAWSARLRLGHMKEHQASSLRSDPNAISAAEHREQILQLQSVIEQLSSANDELRQRSIVEPRESSGPRNDDIQRQLSELQGLYTQSLSDQKQLRDMLQEMEELCEDLEKDNSDKETQIKKLAASLATPKAPQPSTPTAPTVGSGPNPLAAELQDLQDQLAEEKQRSTKYLSFTRRLLGVTKLLQGGTAAKDNNTDGGFIGDHQIDNAVRLLSQFITSRLETPPAAVTRAPEEASPPAIRIKGLNTTTTTHPSKSDSTLLSQVKDLEDRLRVSETQKDIVTDVKLKRMQDLVMRVHTMNLSLQTELRHVVQENALLKETILSDSKIAKSIKKKVPEGFLNVNSSYDVVMGRVYATPPIQKPNGHN